MHSQWRVQSAPLNLCRHATPIRPITWGPNLAPSPLYDPKPSFPHMQPAPKPASSRAPMSSAPLPAFSQLPNNRTMRPSSSASPTSTSASASTPSQTAEPASSTPGFAVKSAQVTVIGAGPAGLATAIMLARRGYTNINVYERMPEPPAPDDLTVWADFDHATERLYMIGINGRGQATLRNLGVMDRVDRFSSLVKGRMDWVPGSTTPRKQLNTNRSYTIRCIQRDRLASCLLQEVRENYSQVVHVSFNVECVGVEWRQAAEPSAAAGSREVCRLNLVAAPAAAGAGAGAGQEAVGKVQWVEESALVVGADGAGSAVRDGMVHESGGSFYVRRFPDTNMLVYRTIPLFLPPQGSFTEGQDPALDWQPDLNYSSRTGAGLNLDALPTREGPHVAVVLYRPGCKEIKQLECESEHSPGAAAGARAFFQEHFPMFLPALREQDLARFAAKQDSNLPRFSFAGPVLHQGQTACLVGDTIHTVKPYFGQGVNSAFEDVQVLGQCLEVTQDAIGPALQRYSELRATDAEALVQLSRSLDGGFLTFIGPLILDSALHRLMPWIFSPNIIASLQNENWRFSQVRRRKRVDRALQVVLLGAVALVTVTLITRLFKMLLPLVLLALKQLGH